MLSAPLPASSADSAGASAAGSACAFAAAGGVAGGISSAGLPPCGSSSEIIRRMEARISSIVGSFCASGLLLMRSEEHTSELQSLMRISYAVFCLQKIKTVRTIYYRYEHQQIYIQYLLNYHEH